MTARDEMSMSISEGKILSLYFL